MGIAENPTLFTPDYGTKPLTLLKSPVVSAISLVNKGANKKRFFMFKSEDSPVDMQGYYVDSDGNAFDDTFSKYMPLIKAGPQEDQWSTVYCVVAVPGEVDAQKDVWDEETIRDAAHAYLKKSRLINYMHKDLDSVGDLVESAVAPTDMNVGGEYIPKGSWFIAIHPHPEMKKMIESGEITGVSVQGSSKREELNNSHPMVLDLAKGAYDSAVVPRTVTQTDYEVPESKDNMEVPDDTQGPGIVMLQHKLGIPETGRFDTLTRKAVQDWMANKGVPGKPTLATIKLILQEANIEEEQPAAQPQKAPNSEVDATAQQAGQVQAAAGAEGPVGGSGGQEEAIKILKSRGPIYHYQGDSSKTPLWVDELTKSSVKVRLPENEGGEWETATVSLEEIYKCDCEDPESHYAGLAKNVAVEKDHPGMPQSSFGGGPYNPVEAASRFPGAPARAGNGFSSYSYGSHPENLGTQPSQMSPDSSDDELKAAILRALSNGNELLLRHLTDTYNINNAEQIYTFPFTQDELWGLVARYILGRMQSPPSDSMAGQPVYRTDKSLYPEGAGFSMQKVATFDVHRPDEHILDKNGLAIGEGAVVKLSGGKLALVSSVDSSNGTVHVEELPKSGTGEVKIVKASSVARTEMDSHFEGAISTPNAIHSGLQKGVWSGSHGGHDPEAQGKIRYIVRSFGKWARGKQSVAAKKLLERGVVKTPEAANRLAAWLKDQWMHSTKWREGRQMGKGSSTNVDDMGPEELEKMFIVACGEIGDDAQELTHMINEDHHDFEDFLDDKFGRNIEGEAELSDDDMEVAKSFVSIVRGSQSPEEKMQLVEGLLNKNQPSPRSPNNSDFIAAMTALQIGVADALDNEDLQKQESDLEEVMADFGEWLGTFIDAGYYFDYNLELEKTYGKDKNVMADEEVCPECRMSKSMCKCDTMGKSTVLKARGMCKCGMSKGACKCEGVEKAAGQALQWAPKGVTEGDLHDGDFAWVSNNKDLPDSSRRKLPYKIRGEVSERGWRAAWAAVHGAHGQMPKLAGGPSLEQVKAKLLRDKPKSIEVADMEKMDNLKGATVQDSSGRKWIVTAHSGDTLSVVSGKERADVPVSEVKVVRQPMGKADGDMMGEDGMEAPRKKRQRLPVPPRPMGAGAPEAPEAPEAPKPMGDMGGAPEAPKAPKPMGDMGGAPEAPEAGGGEGEGAGSRLARLLAAARKRKKEMEAAGGGGGEAGPMDMGKADEAIAKSASPLTAAKIDRLRETRSFLESVLNYEDEDTFGDTVSEVEDPEFGTYEADSYENTEVEKDVDMDDSNEVTLDQVVEAINGLGDEVDSILTRVEEFETLGSKLDHIGDLAKSLDSTERVDVLEQAVEKLTEVLGAFADTYESVDGIEKRLTALEGQPGDQTAAPVDHSDQLIEKSAPEEPVLFQRNWGSIF